MQTFLSSLLSGCSVYAASVAAGFSDAGVRRWLKLGTVAGSGGVYADLAAAVATARELRETLTGAPVVTPSEVAVRVPDAVTAAPPAPSVPPLKIHEWKAKLARVESLQRFGGGHTHGGRGAAQCDATALMAEVQAEMRSYGLKGVQELPSKAPGLALPRNLTYDRIKTAYIWWCHSTGQPGPTEWQLESHCMRWYYENQAPEPMSVESVRRELAHAE